MKRLLQLVSNGVVLSLALLAWPCLQAHAGVHIFLGFDSPIPETINGTGFTDAMPGTGAAVPPDHPNLDLAANPGKLTFTSTPLRLVCAKRRIL